MAMVAVIGAPQAGATVASLALALAWPGSSLLVDADLDVSPLRCGLLQSQFGGDFGLMHLGTAQRQGALEQTLQSQLVNIADRKGPARLMLLGLTDPAQAGAVEYVWEPLAAVLARIGADPQQPDVLVDLGRGGLAGRHAALARSADILLYVARGSLAGVAAAHPRVIRLDEDLRGAPGLTPDKRLLIVESGGTNRYAGGEVAKHLGLAAVGQLPQDPKTAAWLSDGGHEPRGVRRSALLSAAANTARSLLGVVAERNARIGPPVLDLSGVEALRG